MRKSAKIYLLKLKKLFQPEREKMRMFIEDSDLKIVCAVNEIKKLKRGLVDYFVNTFQWIKG